MKPAGGQTRTRLHLASTSDSPLAQGDAVSGAEPTAPESITTQAYRRLRQDILFNLLQPGEKLRIELLRNDYCFGTTPLREALSLLTSDGLVERFEQRGFRVADATLENFTDIHGMRCLLEERALRQSIAVGNERWEEAIVLSHHRLSRPRRSNLETTAVSGYEWESLHRQFHMNLIAACPSPTLLRFCAQLYDLNIRYRYISAATAYPVRDVEAEHAAIADAVVSRDVENAVDLLTKHYRLTGDFLSERLATGLK